MNAIAQVGGNVAGPLPDAPYPGFAGHEIVHVQLQILPRRDNEPLDFQVKPVATNRLDIDAYAAEVARSHGVTLKGKVGVQRLGDPSPWDIGVTQQCWVLLELDPLVPGWQFYGAGVESKGDVYSYDFGMRYAMPDGSPPQPGPIPGDGCKVVYFGVGRRDYPNGHHYTNLLIEFLRASDGRRFKVIFDPDVPNLGGSHIP